jgi:Rhodopirellula transposase DDE domain
MVATRIGKTIVSNRRIRRLAAGLGPVRANRRGETHGGGNTPVGIIGEKWRDAIHQPHDGEQKQSSIKIAMSMGDFGVIVSPNTVARLHQMGYSLRVKRKKLSTDHGPDRNYQFLYVQ